MSDPSLPEERRAELVKDLMDVRRALRGQADASMRAQARSKVNDAKVALGERGEPWWRDGAPDYNRRMAKNTPYADWFAQLQRDDPLSSGT
jgi:hypothetical protein